MNSELLIIIPAYNEEENIEKTVDVIRNQYSQYDYIVVNDGSKDNTANICKKRGGRINSRHPWYGRLTSCRQMLGVGKLSQQFLQQDLLQGFLEGSRGIGVYKGISQRLRLLHGFYLLSL